jgi:glycosyltransferase involved in cell wall biosynthesis
VLNREQVASLLKESDIFLDFSIYQAFGRTGLEAMACGCASVLPVKGGINEYAVDKENSMLADTGNDDECFRAVDLLVKDNELREKIKLNGILKSAEYSIRKAALSELLLFREYIYKKKLSKPIEASLAKTGLMNSLRKDKKSL